MTAYTRANTDWFAACDYGIGVHWTAQSVPFRGAARPFREAVAQFKLAAFLDAVEMSGARYVIFTATHALQMLPCPHPVVEALLPGRTTERDLLGEIAQGLADRGLHLLVYYNHSCNQADDPAWEHAVGYHRQPKDGLADHLCAIVRWMGERYGALLRAWWFDSSYALDARGPHNSVTTDLQGFQFPWARYAAAAKAGYAERLVTFNAGVAQDYLYTAHQDYWAGELVDLDTPPTGRYLPTGLQWHGWTCLEDRRWVYTDTTATPPPPLYSDDALLAFLTASRAHAAPMSFNVIIDQEGVLAETSVRQLRRIRQRLG